MEFNERLQKLRREKGITQEELAKSLYVSRTAISKWESGRGYPNIDSLRAIADYFSLTLDELLSANEALDIAEKNQKNTESHLKDLVFGLVDIFMSLLLFLPLFTSSAAGAVKEASLLSLDTRIYLKIAYFAAVIASTLTGILALALQNFTHTAWVKTKIGVSLFIGALAVLLFIISRHPYAALFAFSLLAIKAVMLIKRP